MGACRCLQGGSTTRLSSSCVCLHCAAAYSSFARLQQYHSEAGQNGELHRERPLTLAQSCDYAAPDFQVQIGMVPSQAAQREQSVSVEMVQL